MTGFPYEKEFQRPHVVLTPLRDVDEGGGVGATIGGEAWI
jgi:hypothetical protein